MQEFLNPVPDNLKTGDAGSAQPRLSLISPKQWSYIARRYNLTPREVEIAKLLCPGLRNCSIANHLHIRPSTVKTHTRNIYRKAHVKSKIAMLLRFVAASREIPTSYEETHAIPISD